MRRWIVRAVLAVLVIATLAVGWLGWTIGPRNLIGMALYDQRRDGDLVVGAPAPAHCSSQASTSSGW